MSRLLRNVTLKRESNCMNNYLILSLAHSPKVKLKSVFLCDGGNLNYSLVQTTEISLNSGGRMEPRQGQASMASGPH